MRGDYRVSSRKLMTSFLPWLTRNHPGQMARCTAWPERADCTAGDGLVTPALSPIHTPSSERKPGATHRRRRRGQLRDRRQSYPNLPDTSRSAVDIRKQARAVADLDAIVGGPGGDVLVRSMCVRMHYTRGKGDTEICNKTERSGNVHSQLLQRPFVAP